VFLDRTFNAKDQLLEKSFTGTTDASGKRGRRTHAPYGDSRMIQIQKCEVHSGS